MWEAASRPSIRRHAEQAGMPSTEINEVADLVVVRPDPETVAA